MRFSFSSKTFTVVQILALLSSLGLLAIERMWMRELAASRLALLGFCVGTLTSLIGIIGLVASRFRNPWPLLTLALSFWFLVTLLAHLSKY